MTTDDTNPAIHGVRAYSRNDDGPRHRPGEVAEAGLPARLAANGSVRALTRTVVVVRRYPLLAFLGWFFTVGQAIAFIPFIARTVLDVDVRAEPFLIAACLVGLLLPTFVITRITDGADGVRAIRRRTLQVRAPVRWYALSVVGVPLIMIAATAASFGPPAQISASLLASALTSGLLLHLVVVFVTVNWWEETAWMGFVQARLQERHGPVRAAVITGALFALGHISQFIEGSVAQTLPVLALLVAVCIPFRALQAWVYNRTGSLALVGLVHAAANATAVGSVLGIGLLDRLYPGVGAGGLVFPVLGAVGLVIFATTRGRLGHRSAVALSLPNTHQSRRTH